MILGQTRRWGPISRTGDFSRRPFHPERKEYLLTKEEFQRLLQAEAEQFNAAVSTANGDWIVKGFIDIAKNIYTISVDTKVISKIMELLLIPHLTAFSDRNRLKFELAEYQNHYPDLCFEDEEGTRFAVDIKSTYRRDLKTVNGMTLGAFTGYFRNRSSTKNIRYPYESYAAHFVLGLIYSQAEGEIDEKRQYQLDELETIKSVVNSFEFFVQEKYKIAVDRPGSGNTKNIGSVTSIQKLIGGEGPFTELGVEVFDDFWMYYMTKDMAQKVELAEPPYTNLPSYHRYKETGRIPE